MRQTRRGLPRAALVLLCGAAATVILGGVHAIAGIIGPLFLALVITIAVQPIRVSLDRMPLPPWSVSILMLVSVYLILIGLVASLVLSVARMGSIVTDYTPEIQDRLSDVGAWLGDRGVAPAQVDAILSAFDPAKLLDLTTAILSSLLGILSSVFFLAALLLFMALDTSKITRAFAVIEPDRPEVVAAVRGFAAGTRSYMHVSGGFGLIVAAIDWVALTLLGIPGAFVWGILAFITNFIPNIGFVIGVIPPALIALLDGGPSLMIAVIVVYCVVNFVIQSVIQPRVVGNAVGLTAILTFMSLVFWAWAIGPIGAVLAVPLTLFLKAVLIDSDPAARWVLPMVSGTSDHV